MGERAVRRTDWRWLAGIGATGLVVSLVASVPIAIAMFALGTGVCLSEWRHA